MSNTDQKTSLLNYQTILQSAPDLYLILNPQLEIVEVSDAYLDATMVKRHDVLGHHIFEIFPDNPNDPLATGTKNLRHSLEIVLTKKIPDTMAVQKYDIRRPLSEGGEFEERYWSPINLPVLGKNNEVQYIIHRVEDVTQFVHLKELGAEQQKTTDALRMHVGEMEMEIYKRAQEIQEANKKLQLANDRLEHVAYFDILTDLPNRKQLTEKMNQFLLLANYNHCKVAVMFMDLDHFKLINDTLGHNIGDHLLQVISKRLRREIKENDFIARLGGDEFVILINKIHHVDEAVAVAKRILQKIKKPFSIDGHSISMSISIGMSVYPDDGRNEITLLKNADIAMYSAKQRGRNTCQVFNTTMISEAQKKIALENTLRDAVYEKKFVLYYQPQINLKTGKICGIETLLRLPGADGSLLFPSEFMPIIKEIGLTMSINAWMLETACKQYQEWKKTLPIEKECLIQLSVNFSEHQLEEPGFVDMVKTTLEQTGCSPANLELEITEYAITPDNKKSTSILRQLKSMGIHIALDNFGEGYSSLNYLRQFHIDTLKIDEALINHIPSNDIDSEIVKIIIHMAHTMKTTVIAEGVTTKKQLQFLIEHHCDIVQSTYFSDPLLEKEMTALLKEKKQWEIRSSR